MVQLYWDIEEDVEDIEKYTTGGFHPIRLGDILSSTKVEYRVLHKLGHGSFSTVWLAEALQEPSTKYFALKICVANADPKHELEIFDHISRAPPLSPHVLQVWDHFSLQGPNGVHTILVLDILGSLQGILNSPNVLKYKHIRKLCCQITTGLAALHLQGIVHGDLHSGNIGISLPRLNDYPPKKILGHFSSRGTIVLPTTYPAHPDALPPYLVSPISIVDYLIDQDEDPFDETFHAKIMDLGSAIVVNEHTHPVTTSTAVCAPELIFKIIACPTDPAPSSTRASDIWSLACTIYELVFGDKLFPFANQRTILGRIAMLCGEVPQEWKAYWESQEHLRSLPISHATAEAEWNRRLKDLTEDEEGEEEGDLMELFTLLRSMLIIDSTRRPSAEEVLNHPWFSH